MLIHHFALSSDFNAPFAFQKRLFPERKAITIIASTEGKTIKNTLKAKSFGNVTFPIEIEIEDNNKISLRLYSILNIIPIRRN